MRTRAALQDLVARLAARGWLPAEVEGLGCGCRMEPETKVLVLSCHHPEHEPLLGAPIVSVQTVETGGRM